jgi:hypothetical protein
LNACKEVGGGNISRSSEVWAKDKCKSTLFYFVRNNVRPSLPHLPLGIHAKDILILVMGGYQGREEACCWVRRRLLMQ